MPIQHNQTWDSEGNLLFEEWVEVPEPETSIQDLVDALTQLPQESLLAIKNALGL